MIYAFAFAFALPQPSQSKTMVVFWAHTHSPFLHFFSFDCTLPHLGFSSFHMLRLRLLLVPISLPVSLCWPYAPTASDFAAAGHPLLQEHLPYGRWPPNCAAPVPTGAWPSPSHPCCVGLLSPLFPVFRCLCLSISYVPHLHPSEIPVASTGLPIGNIGGLCRGWHIIRCRVVDVLWGSF